MDTTSMCQTDSVRVRRGQRQIGRAVPSAPIPFLSIDDPTLMASFTPGFLRGPWLKMSTKRVHFEYKMVGGVYSFLRPASLGVFASLRLCVKSEVSQSKTEQN